MPAPSTNRKPAGKARIPSPKPATDNDECDSHHEDVQTDSEAATDSEADKANSEADESDDIQSMLNRRPKVVRSVSYIDLPSSKHTY
jgi:hypothetical protein